MMYRHPLPPPSAVYLAMRWALREQLGDGLHDACCVGGDGGAERTHHLLPLHDTDEPAAASQHRHGRGAGGPHVAGGKDASRVVHEMVPLVSRHA